MISVHSTALADNILTGHPAIRLRRHDQTHEARQVNVVVEVCASPAMEELRCVRRISFSDAHPLQHILIFVSI